MANQKQNKTQKQPHKRRNADPPARYAFRHPAEKQSKKRKGQGPTQTTTNKDLPWTQSYKATVSQLKRMHQTNWLLPSKHAFCCCWQTTKECISCTQLRLRCSVQDQRVGQLVTIQSGKETHDPCAQTLLLTGATGCLTESTTGSRQCYSLQCSLATPLLHYSVLCFNSITQCTVQETNWDAQREKACVNTYAHASASQICLRNICGQQQNFPMAGPTFGSKSGPQNGAQAKT